MKKPFFMNYGRDRKLAYSFCILLAIVFVFLAIRSAGFLTYDDGMLVYENPYYVKPDASLLYFWTHPFIGLYMPISYTVWGILAKVTRTASTSGGVSFDPTVFHSVSLLLHAGNSLLVFSLLGWLLKAPVRSAGQMQATRHADFVQDGAALAGALLFALHPLQVESVAWISELKGLLAAFFCLAALLMFCRFLDESDVTAGTARAVPTAEKWWLLSVLCYGGALLSKPSAVGLPLIALLVSVLLWRRPVLSTLRSLGLWFAMSLAMAVAMTGIQPAAQKLGNYPFGLRLLVASDALSFYLKKLAWPAGLTINYGHSPAWLAAQPDAKWTFLVPLGLVFILWFVRRRPLLCLALCWAFISLLPNLGLVPFYFQEYSTVADRYFYFAMIGPALVLSCTVVAIYSRWPRGAALAAYGALALVLAAMGVLAKRQSETWVDSKMLYSHAISINPRDYGALGNLGNLYRDAGEYDMAIKLYQASLAIYPKGSPSYYSMAVIQRRLHQTDAALKSYRLALKYDPNMYGARLELGTLLAERGRKSEALKEFEALGTQEGFAAAANVDAGWIYLQQGAIAQAEKAARRAIAADENYEDAHLQLGVILQQKKDERGAIAEYGQALALDPRSAKARISIARLLAGAGGKGKAMSILQEGLQIAPRDAELRAELKRMLDAQPVR